MTSEVQTEVYTIVPLTASVEIPQITAQVAVATPTVSASEQISASTNTVPIQAQPYITLPSTSGVASGTPIRAPNGDILTLRNLAGDIITFKFL